MTDRNDDLCAAEGCTNTVPARTGRRGRPHQYCSPECRPGRAFEGRMWADGDGYYVRKPEGLAAKVCEDCGRPLLLKVVRSTVGQYVYVGDDKRVPLGNSEIWLAKVVCEGSECPWERTAFLTHRGAEEMDRWFPDEPHWALKGLDMKDELTEPTPLREDPHPGLKVRGQFLLVHSGSYRAKFRMDSIDATELRERGHDVDIVIFLKSGAKVQLPTLDCYNSLTKVRDFFAELGSGDHD